MTTKDELVEKLREMREGGRKDVMTRLFGLIFDHEIGKFSTSAKEIAEEYNNRGYVGRVNHAIIQDGRNLAAHVDPHYNVIRRWCD